MPRVASQIGKAAAVLGLIFAPFFVHVALATRHGMVAAGILVVAEAGMMAWIALSAVSGRRLRWFGCAAVLIVTALVWQLAPDGIFASSGIPHAIAYVSLLAIFGASLATGRKPIVTMFAERSRGTLSPSLIRYTRRVTWAWCVFAAGQLLGSVLLLSFAPVHVWWVFVNTLNFPLLAAMFCAEFIWRKWRHGVPHERLTDGFRMAGQITTHDGA
jgi:uncharacterized membrane protein